MRSEPPATAAAAAKAADTFAGRYGRYERGEQAANEPLTRVDKPHNVLLERAVDTGVPGAIAYLALVVVAAAGALRSLDRGPERLLVAAFLASLVAYLVQGLFSIDVPPLAAWGGS